MFRVFHEHSTEQDRENTAMKMTACGVLSPPTDAQAVPVLVPCGTSCVPQHRPGVLSYVSVIVTCTMSSLAFGLFLMRL